MSGDQSYGLNKAWGQCPHVVSATSTLIPATLNPATCAINRPASLVAAVNNGFTVEYMDPLFNSVKGMEFNAVGKPE